MVGKIFQLITSHATRTGQAEGRTTFRPANKFVQGKFEEYGQLWDGKVPPYDSVLAAQEDQTIANKAVFRLTNRLHDIGFGKSTPVIYEQTWPNKNYGLWCDANGVDASAVYTIKVHSQIFDTPPLCECCGQELPA